MPDRAPDLLSVEITLLADRVDRLKAIRQMMSDDPDVTTLLTKVITQPAANGRITVPPAPGQTTADPKLDKIVAYLKTRSPEDWVRVNEIAAETDVEKANVYFVLNRLHPDLFETNQPSPKKKFYRLKKDAKV